jgi:type I restriction enzyme S subunit
VTATAFGDLFQFIRNGMSVKQDKSGDGLPISRIETISDGSVNPHRVGFAGLSADAAEGWFLEVGDILFSHINSVEHVGKCAVYRGLPDRLVHGMNLLSLRCDQSKISPEFAKYLIRSPGFRNRLASFINKAVNQASVSIGNLRTIPVNVPSLREQRRIAAILDQADALRAKRREALAQLDSLTQSIFIEMFGDPRRAGSTGSEPTEPRLLGELARIRTGKLDANAADEDGAYPFFTCAVKPLRIDTAAFDCKATLVAGNGDLNVKYYEGKFNAYQRTYVIESLNERHLAPRFLFGFLDLYVAELRKQAIGGVIKYIKLPYLTDAVIQVPDEGIQVEFAERLMQVERIKAAQVRAATETEALFTALQHRAFAGTL